MTSQAASATMTQTGRPVAARTAPRQAPTADVGSPALRISAWGLASSIPWMLIGTAVWLLV